MGVFEAKKAVPHEWSSGRITLRVADPADADAIREAVDESRAQLLPWMVWAKDPKTLAQQEEVCIMMRAQFDLRQDLPYLILARETGRFLGGTGLHRMDWTLGFFEIGYWIRTSETGKGYAKEASRVMTAMAFDVLRASKVTIHCAETNVRSNPIPRRLGFHLDGMLRKHTPDANGILHNLNVYSLLAEEWAEAKARWNKEYGD